jgi:hypothetical protein
MEAPKQKVNLKALRELKPTERVLPPNLSKGRKLEMDAVYRPSFKERLMMFFGGVIVVRCSAFTALNPGAVQNQIDVHITPETDVRKVKVYNRIASYLNVKIKRDAGLLAKGFLCNKCGAVGEYKVDGSTPPKAVQIQFENCPSCVPDASDAFCYIDANGNRIGG